MEVILSCRGRRNNAPPVITVSIDEKPRVQALGTTAPDLPPDPGKHAAFGRDYEYVRHGTVSILAALDLHTGEVIANVEERHRSQEFIALLKRLDDHYPKETVIWVVLDNHSAHVSRETMAILPRGPIASSMSIRPGMDPGSTWWRRPFQRWTERFFAISGSLRKKSSRNAS